MKPKRRPLPFHFLNRFDQAARTKIDLITKAAGETIAKIVAVAPGDPTDELLRKHLPPALPYLQLARTLDRETFTALMRGTILREEADAQAHAMRAQTAKAAAWSRAYSQARGTPTEKAIAAHKDGTYLQLADTANQLADRYATLHDQTMKLREEADQVWKETSEADQKQGNLRAREQVDWGTAWDFAQT